MTVFRNYKHKAMDPAAYAADAAQMEAMARAQPGFLSFKSFTAEDGEVVAISEWADAASARAWGAHPQHRAVQDRGRAEYYASYTSIGCDEPQVRRFAAADDGQVSISP